MDLAFALAVLDATQHPPALTAEAKEIQARLAEAEDALAAEQARVAQLTAAEAKASGAQKDALDDQLKLAQAQLELEQDEVDDAKQELIRAGGDLQDRIQAMAQEHDAASQASDATKLDVSAPIEPHGLIQRFRAVVGAAPETVAIVARETRGPLGGSGACAEGRVSRAPAWRAGHRRQNDASTGPVWRLLRHQRPSPVERALRPAAPPAAPPRPAKPRRPYWKQRSAAPPIARPSPLWTNASTTKPSWPTTYGQWIDMVAAEQRRS